MIIQAHYRILIDERVSEESAEITPGSTDEVLTLLATKAPFGIRLLATAPGQTATVLSELVVGVRGDCAAMYYTDETGSWYSHGRTPDDDGPVYAEVDFPEHCEFPAVSLRSALDYYCRTGSRPSGVDWQQDPCQA
ncbi:Imm1 family immunity protein [Actinokineospora sp. 24-640]